MKPRLPHLIIIALCLFFALTVQAQTTRPDFNRKSDYDVQHYVLRVNFDREKRKVNGDTIVRLKPIQNDLREVVLDSVDISYTSVTLESGSVPLKHKTGDDKIAVTLDRAYAAGETIGIRFQYSATPKKGIYFIPEERQPNNRKVHSDQIWTQGEPDEARHWFPSFDFPSDKATTEQFITARKGETVIGNGHLVSESDNGDGSATFHYKMDVPFSTYLVSFVIGEYAKVAEKYKEIPLGMYVYPGRESIVPKAFGKTKDALRVFEELTKTPYPFNKYDQTIVSGFTFGGMENITATTMADSEIFLSEFPFAASAVEDLMSHEAAHSWFGNLVTCKNWAELWLNEGFATFMEAAFREKMYGRAAYIQKVRADADIFLADDAVNPKRNGLFNQNANDVAALFDRPATTYNKGGVVLHMLREQIGDEAFWNGVTVYLSRHRFSNVETADLQAAMETASGTKLGWFFNQWVYGLGSPKLNITQSYSPRKKSVILTVTQTQKTDKLTPEAYQLPIDVEVITEKGAKSHKLDISQRTETFIIATDGKPVRIVLDKKEKIPLKTVKLGTLTIK